MFGYFYTFYQVTVGMRQWTIAKLLCWNENNVKNLLHVFSSHLQHVFI
jgi:hypothetical protein